MKCYFYYDEIYFLEFLISSQEISIEVEKIGIVKIWPESISIRVFIYLYDLPISTKVLYKVLVKSLFYLS